MANATKDKEAQATAKPVKQEIVNMAELIKSRTTLDAATGVATVAKDLYEHLLPEDLPRETVERVQAVNAEIAAAATLAIGELAIPAMKKNKDLSRVTLNIPATGRDSFEVTFDRSRQVRSAPGSDEMVTKFGTTNVGFVTYGTRNRGQLAAVKAQLAEQATKALGK